MKKFNYPTNIIFGEGALQEFAKTLGTTNSKKPLIVSDATLKQVGLVDQVVGALSASGLTPEIFTGVDPNPTEKNIDQGAEKFNQYQCDCLVALGGGSPMDAAKAISIRATQDRPLADYDDAKGGDALIDAEKLVSIFAIPTTAGTGSEVGRCGVIVMNETNDKTIFFHPKLLPEIAVLEPSLLTGLPKSITAATGIDAFTHSLEAFFAPGFDPMADGIALESIRLILKNLPLCLENGEDLSARGKMLMASLMGATAFQKGLGMIHSLAHPLSSEKGLHHGLANALLLPRCVEFLENKPLNTEQQQRFQRVLEIFEDCDLKSAASLSKCCESFIASVGIAPGLSQHGVREVDLDLLSTKAFKDVCHQTNMLPVTQQELRSCYQAAI